MTTNNINTGSNIASSSSACANVPVGSMVPRAGSAVGSCVHKVARVPRTLVKKINHSVQNVTLYHHAGPLVPGGLMPESDLACYEEIGEGYPEIAPATDWLVNHAVCTRDGQDPEGIPIEGHYDEVVYDECAPAPMQGYTRFQWRISRQVRMELNYPSVTPANRVIVSERVRELLKACLDLRTSWIVFHHPIIVEAVFVPGDTEITGRQLAHAPWAMLRREQLRSSFIRYVPNWLGRLFGVPTGASFASRLLRRWFTCVELFGGESENK